MEFARKFDARRIESEVRAHLATVDLRGGIRAAKNGKKIIFIEGPPTMNGSPHAGHLRGRIIKDLWYRFNTLRGMQIEFNAGWDTQGLPIELQAEKELGVTGGKAEAIKQFGVETIVAECKKVVAKYTEEWVWSDQILGISLDHDSAYRTLDDEFIEREWKVLKRAKESQVIIEDYTVVAYCPSCQTSLSHAEVGQGYKEVTDPSMYYTVRLKGATKGDDDDSTDKDEYLVVWTTMPFTLVTDAMVGVHPDEEYVHIKVGDRNKTWIVGKTRLAGFLAEIKAGRYYITGSTHGKDLEGRRYEHPLVDQIDGLAQMVETYSDKYHTIVADGFVDVNTGSGLVHIAPANGEEDIRVARDRGIKVFSPIDDEVRFTDQAGARYKGLYVRDADDVVVSELRERGALVSIGKIRHSYPHCWRSGHGLVWLARKGFFYDTSAIGDHTTKAAQDVEYFFEQPKNRFLGIINDRHPWCISRERVWGCPLPAWRCKDCGALTWCFSREEIVRGAADLPDGPSFELHKPWIDNVRMHCKDCHSANTRREDFVLDTWHNSGSAPWSSLSDSEYTNSIPAPFLTEGIDQTRGWAYTLLLENVIMQGAAVAPFKSFLFQGHVLDKNGQKMSKSKGNVLDGREILSKESVDMIRLYFMWKASPIEPLSFDMEEMASRPHQILSTLYNLHLYYIQNSRYDNFDGSTHTIRWAEQNGLLREPDVWLISKLHKLIHTTTEKIETCRFHEAARALDDYIINIFSQTYIRITRGEIWNEDESGRDRRLAIYAVLCYTLKTLDVMMHPFCPHITEYLWQTAFEEGADHKAELSILFATWPSHNLEIVDSKLEESFDTMLRVISTANAARMAGKLKGRWPLDMAVVCVSGARRTDLKPRLSLLKEQLNVEKVNMMEISRWYGPGHVLNLKEAGAPITLTASLNTKSVGPKARERMGALIKKFQDLSPEEVIQVMYDHGAYDVVMEDGHIIQLDRDDILTGFNATDGFAFSAKNPDVSDPDDIKNNGGDSNDGDGCIVFLTTSRNRDMTAKGLVKDVARRLQSLRKERGYNPTDVLECASILDTDAESLAMLKENSRDLAFLVRVRTVTFEETCKEYVGSDIDGRKIRISVE